MKKCLSILLSSILCLTLLSGCGTNASSPSTDESVNAETTSQGTVNLRIWACEEDSDLLTEICANFKQKYSGTTFNLTVEPMAESECRDYILDDVNNAPDVFTFADDQFAAMCAAGVLNEIPNNDEIAKRNSAGAVEAATMNGKLYAYPLTADNGYFLFYNKKYLSESDLGSFDTLLAKAASLEKEVTMDMSSGWYLYSFFGNTGLTLGLNDDGISNYCTWNSTENDITGVDVAKGMMKLAATPGFKSGGDGDLGDGAKADTVIAGVSGVWMSTTLTEAWGNNLGATKLPTYDCNGKEVQLASYAGYKLVGVNSYSSNLDWANTFADYLTSEECQSLRFQYRQQGPSNINAASNPEVIANVGIQALIKQSDYASLQRVGGAYWSPAGAFGQQMVNQNPSGQDLQDVMDVLVADITAAH